MDGAQGQGHGLAAVLARAALVLALAGGAWSVYRRLPEGEQGALGGEPAEATNLRVVLRRESLTFPLGKERVPFHLYPINLSTARNEYASEPRPGVRFEDFVMRQMGNRQPVKGVLGESGETIVAVPPGRWWVYAAVSGEQVLAWRLPVNVTGRELTIELTYDNAYLRAKRF